MQKPSSSLSSYIPGIPGDDHLWLETVCTANKQNRRLTTPQIRSQLRDQIPRNYDPNVIDRRLIHPSHEEITPLGIIAITCSEDWLEKGDRVIQALQDILLDHPGIQRVDTTEIAGHTGLPLNEIGLMIYFLYSFGRPFESYGSKTTDYFGAEYIIFNSFNNDGIMQLRSMKEEVISQLERIEKLQEEPSEEAQAASTATQVLVVHYLLKHCGINGFDHKTETAELIQFLTGKETGTKRVQDTNIYKRVRQPLKLNDKACSHDLQTIRPLFLNLGMKEIVDMIDKEAQVSMQLLPKK